MSKVKWDLVSPLKDKEIFKKIEEKYNIKIPIELKKLCEKNNGGFPTPFNVDVPGIGERDFKMLLSYNIDDPENIFHVLEFFIKKTKKNLFPFGVDSFSGYYCLRNRNVVYFNTETLSAKDFSLGLSDFFELFY